MTDLFADEELAAAERPLADRMRPACLDEFFGQAHLLEAGFDVHVVDPAVTPFLQRG